MANKVYCYGIRSAGTGKKLVGGTVHADSMEDAARRILRRDKIKIVVVAKGVRPDGYGWQEVKLTREGKEVYVSVSVHPENFMSPREMEASGA